MNRYLRAALQYAELGWPVLPLYEPIGDRCSCGNTQCRVKGKHPRIASGLRAASIEPHEIEFWWSYWPRANIAVCTGYNLLVVDIDGPVGAASAAKLKLPPTVEVHTGRGKHLYYSTNDTVRSTSGRLGKGIDTRGVGGYVVAPPSQHVTGTRYRWRWPPHWYELAPLPEWIKRVIQAPRPVQERSLESRETVQGEGRDTSRSGLDADRTIRLVQQGLDRTEIQHRFAHFSEKYQERLGAYGQEAADGYFEHVYSWAQRFQGRAKRRWKVIDASLEVLRGPQPLARVLLTLRDPETKQRIRADVVVGSPVWTAVAPDIDPAELLRPNGHALAVRFVGRQLDAAVRDGRIVWIRQATT